MIWPFHDKAETSYWLKVFGWYAVAEATVQLIFFFIFNTFTSAEGSNIEYHFVMLLFHCLLIWPIWWVARMVRKEKIWVQIFVNLVFAFIYGYFWFVPVQEAIAIVYNNLLDFTKPGNTQDGPTIDSSMHYAVLNYQILKHAFRLSWYYLADYFFSYRNEEKKKTELAVSNKELQLKLLKWHLNPSFYFKTIKHLQNAAVTQPSNATEPILQLAKVMEYVIYEARQPQIEMKKEIQFLDNYIQLLNQQPDNSTRISFRYTNGYEALRIAPLLLAGLVDNIVAAGRKGLDKQCSIDCSFMQDELHFTASGMMAKPDIPPLLEELYPGKFSIDYSPGKLFKLRLQLDAG